MTTAATPTATPHGPILGPSTGPIAGPSTGPIPVTSAPPAGSVGSDPHGTAPGERAARRPKRPKRPRTTLGARWDAPRRYALERYLRDLADTLDLRDWEIVVGWDDPAGDHADAEVSVVDGRRCATVHLSDTFDDLSGVEQSRVLCHELLHLHTAVLSSCVHAGLETVKGGALFLGVFDQLEESMVDALAVAIARLVPPVPWAAAPDAGSATRALTA